MSYKHLLKPKQTSKQLDKQISKPKNICYNRERILIKKKESTLLLLFQPQDAPLIYFSPGGPAGAGGQYFWVAEQNSCSANICKENTGRVHSGAGNTTCQLARFSMNEPGIGCGQNVATLLNLPHPPGLLCIVPRGPNGGQRLGKDTKLVLCSTCGFS